jgi:hypothetical protein
MSDSKIRYSLLGLLKKYDENAINTEYFVATYQKLWRKWRDSEDRKSLNDRALPDILDRAFTASDCFKPSSVGFQLKYDLDENGLKLAIHEIIGDIHKL